MEQAVIRSRLLKMLENDKMIITYKCFHLKDSHLFHIQTVILLNLSITVQTTGIFK